MAIVLALVCRRRRSSPPSGSNPIELAGNKCRQRTFGIEFGLEDLGLLVTPLILTGLAVAVALRVGLWNIGAEGQFYTGAFCRDGIGLFARRPDDRHDLRLMVVAGILGGALWILVPALARAYARSQRAHHHAAAQFRRPRCWSITSRPGPGTIRAAMTLGATARIAYEMPEFYGDVHWGFPLAIVLAVVMAGLS